MRNQHSILAVALLATALSCVHKETGPERVTFKAIMADDPATRTILQSDGSVFWSPRDSINLFYGTSFAMLTADNIAASAQASFTGELDGFLPNGQDEFWAVYPYSSANRFDGSAVTLTLPNQQNGVAGTFDADLFVSLARSKDYTLQFYNLCGGVKFSVAQTGIQYVTFRGNANEVLAGQVTVAFDTDGKPQVQDVLKGATELRLNAPEGGFEVGKWYYIVALPVTLSAGYTMTFFKDADGTGAVERAVETPVTIKRSTWGRLTDADDVTTPINPSKYLTFTSEGTTTISLVSGVNRIDPVVYYSTDAQNWEQWDYSEITFTNDKPLYMCGNNPEGFNQFNTNNNSLYIRTFSASGDSFSVSGDIMSLLDMNSDLLEIPIGGCFYELFNGCTRLTSAPALPATALTEMCYEGMFKGCSSLKFAPELPASNVTSQCYREMFLGCSSLETAPQLPATKLASWCYYGMFSGCSSLTEAPDLPATDLARDCYNTMFASCSSLTTAPSLPATDLAPTCYSYMFSGCSSLTDAPELPATTLTGACYSYMFNECTSLTASPALPATTLAERCYECMFAYCSNLVSLPEILPATTLSEYCYSLMFGYCYKITTAPELPAPVLVKGCYNAMFTTCSNLSHLKCLATDISAYGCTTFWLDHVASTGIFVKAPEMQEWVADGSSDGIPTGWTIENADGSANISPNKYLTFTSEGTTTVSLTNNGGNAPVLYYSKDTNTWFQWDYSELTFKANEPLYICGDNPQGLSHREDGVDGVSNSQFVSSGDSFAVSGDIMSLLNKDTDLLAIPSSWCFVELFRGCANMTAAPSLPATELAPYCYYNLFRGCSSLATAPELPATTMTQGCYTQLFRDCSSLSAVPQLPATVLARTCYAFMYSGCTGITSVPEDCLPATQLEELCYEGLFQGCTNLTNAPSLPATTLASQCYRLMFSGCALLRTAPELPATSLAERCYWSMFTNCSSLTEAPELPAETLEAECYSLMFQGCTSLTAAPVLPASVLTEKCYYLMLNGCTNLQYVRCLATDISASDCLYRWLAGVSASGTFVKSPDNHSWSLGEDGIPYGWTVENSDGSEVFTASNYLTFTSTGNSTLTIGNTGGNAPVLYYSYDQLNWNLWDYGQLDFTTLYLCGDNPNGFSVSDTQASTMVVGGDNCHISGNVMSLLNKDEVLLTIPSDYCFYALFYTSSNILTAPSLPATELTDYCYGRMFEQCRELTSAPELPATTLTNGCYTRMFASCEALTTAPALPATALAPSCYESMFYYCTTLATPPSVLPATELAEKCCYGMFQDCWSLSEAPELPATTLAEQCYYLMFASARNLTVAPELPAEVLTKKCYTAMFSDCQSLSEAPALPATTLAESCYYEMFNSCKVLTVAPETLPATTLAPSCYVSMFAGCTSLTTAPVLPAQTLVWDCYTSMFNQCSSLNYVKCLATDMSASGSSASCLTGWLNGVSSTGTFVKAANAQWPSGVSGIPEGWTVEEL
jgi:hypothetical protein